MARCCADSGVKVMLIPSLYDIADDNPLWGRLAEVDSPALLLSDLHPRPAKLLLARHELADRFTVVNIADYGTVEEVCAEVKKRCVVGESAASVADLRVETPPRWYPMLDDERCINCGHCLQFCLFGVYEHDAQGQVVVIHPEKCKPGCPACSRICPQGAIIFPHYRKDAAIAGAPGLYMQPDAAARRMYYTRTKIACPVCGQLAQPGNSAGDCCPECGGPVKAATVIATEPDELDDLIDDLEKFSRKEL